jgi:restriction endonuclease Mrr
MPIPDYQTCMLPLFKPAAGGSGHSTPEAIESLAKRFNLNDQEIAVLLPSTSCPGVTRGHCFCHGSNDTLCDEMDYGTNSETGVNLNTQFQS